MNTHTVHQLEPEVQGRTPNNRQPSPATAHPLFTSWHTAILSADGVFLVLAGVMALAADLVGYFFAVGPFATLAGQPLTLGVVEAHGLAVLVGALMLRATTADQWRWHAVALLVHLFLGMCNLLFWEVYTTMGAAPAGIMSTTAHATFFGLQLACLALGSTRSCEKLPEWLRRARRAGLYVRSMAIGTLLLGAGTHIAVIVLGREAQPRILTPSFELLLTVPMFYVSLAGWLAWRTFRFRGRWHKIALGLILIYFPIGLPFHLITITTGSTAHYAAFPERYSLLIVPVMAAFIACFASLRLPNNRP
jgi:hypothetical protein